MELKPTFQFTKSSHLKVKELYDILTLRSNVFIVEHKCPVADVDGDDLKPHVTHCYATIDNVDGIIGYARLERDSKTMLIRRVVVSPEFRGQGISQKLMLAVIDYCKELELSKIELHARAYLENFYRKLGFITTSDVYIKLEINVPHVDMEMLI